METRFRWGILGTAGIAGEMIRAIRKSRNGAVMAVASRDRGRAERWAAEQSIPRYFGSYAELLESRAVDGIYIPLPNALHAEWTIKALEAGYPVLCEKPITTNAVESEQVRAVAARTGLQVAEAFMYRFHPVYDEVRAMLRKGEIGRISTINSRFTFMLDDRLANAASAEMAGGALLDVGCYCVNVARLLTGCEPVRVSAFMRRSTVDDTVVALLDFPDGVLALCEAGIASFERHQVEVTGTSGTLVIERPWIPGNAEIHFILDRAGHSRQTYSVPGFNSYRLQVEDFANVIRGRVKARWEIGDAVANMRVLDAIADSARTGQIVEIKS